GSRYVRDDEPRHMRKQRYCLRCVAARRLREVKDDRGVVAGTECLAQCVEDTLPLFSKAPEDEHNLRRQRVDDVADLLVVQEQIEELRKLQVVNRDRWVGLDDQIRLLRSRDVDVPGRDSVDLATAQIRISETRV